MWKGIPQVGKVCHMDGIFMTFPTWIIHLPQENFTITKTIFLPEMGLMLTLNQANHSLVSGATCPWVLRQRNSAVCTCKSENQLHFEPHIKKKTRSREVIFVLYSALMRCSLKHYKQVQVPQHKEDMDLSEQVQRRPQKEQLSCEDNSLYRTAQWGEGSYASSHPLSLLLTTAVWIWRK